MLRLDFTTSVFCDALLTDHQGDLLFMSVWGRDTDIQEVLAKLTLANNPDGVRSFNAKGDGIAMRVNVPNQNLLDKQQGRAGGSVFGQLVQAFVYTISIQQPDRVNRVAWALYRCLDDQQQPPDVWPLVMDTCHVPLLPAWREPVLTTFRYRGWIREIKGYRMGAVGVDLGDDNVELVIEELAASRRIQL